MRLKISEFRTKIAELLAKLWQLLREDPSKKKGIITQVTVFALVFGMAALALLIFDSDLLKWFRILVLLIFAFGIIGIGVILLTVRKMW